ncbi:MAG: hypothetical protein HYV07_31610 [Deltaproteobacteria bacterium]|nr:hypothetical protein [Deltaproteobacteria bacterium]
MKTHHLAISTYSALISFTSLAFAQTGEPRSSEDFSLPSDTVQENCIVVAGNQVASVRLDGSYTVTGVPATRGPIRALFQCAFANGTFGKWTGAVEPVPNATLELPAIEGFLERLPPLPVSLVATPTSAILPAGTLLDLTITSEGPTGEQTDVTEDAVIRPGNPRVTALEAPGRIRALELGTSMIGIVFAGRVTVVPITVVENTDRDADGLPNVWELEHGLDPDSPLDAIADPDGDGLVTFDEYAIGTELDRFDTDGDGIGDGDETLVGTNPARFDTDGDGAGDGTDNCPLLANPDQADANSDGRGDVCPGPCGSDADCDDRDACTSNVCGIDGVCVTEHIVGCCEREVDCEDGDACTADACGPGGVCERSAITACCNRDSDCHDGAACTADQCDRSAHTCLARPISGCCSTDSDCADSNACTSSSCDVATGECRVAPVADCCVSDGDCGDGDTCTTDRCVLGTCTNSALPGCCVDDASCADGAYCNGAEACAGVLGCRAGTAPCTDAIACTSEVCDEAARSCSHVPDDSACDDGLACTGVERCSAVAGCVAGTPVDCDDGIDCTIDRCTEANGCEDAPNDAACNNGSDCDGVERCDVVLGCIAGTPPITCEAPLLEYHFDEALGPTAIDSSGLGHHGTLMNGPAWTGGISSGAADFDGINDWVRTARPLAAPDAWTIEAFVFPTARSARGRGFVFFENDFDPVRAAISADGHLFLAGACAAAGELTVPLGAWTHVIITFDGAAARYYVNGELSGSAACSPFAWPWFSVGGTSTSDGTTSFRGRIDELAVHSRVFTDVEARDHAATLMLHFDEGTGTESGDSSSVGYHARLSGPAWVTPGFAGAALSFDGVNDFVEVPRFGNVDLGEGVSIELRVQRSTLGVGQTVFDRAGSAPFRLSFNEVDELVVSVGADEVLSSAAPIDDASWHQIRVTARGGSYAIEIDGELDSSTSAGPSILPVDPASSLFVGARSDGAAPFAGLLDELRVGTNVELDTSVLARYSFDEAGGRIVHDAGSSGLDGQLVGTATFAPGLAGTAVRFGVGADRIEVPFSGPTPGRWTMRAWVFDDAGEGVSRTIASVYSTDGNRAWWLTPQNRLQFNPCGDGSSPVPRGRWVNVAMTYDGATLRYYIDGRLDAAVGCGAQPLTALRLGSSFGDRNPFRGGLDQFDFQSRVLSAEEIAAGASLVALSFDVPRRSRVDDSSGFSNHGRLSVGTFSTGLSGLALELNGVDTMVTIPSSDELGLRGDFQIDLILQRTAGFGVAQTLVSKSDGGPGGWQLYFNSEDQLAFALDGFGDVVVGSTRIEDTLWHTVSVRRNGETFRVFLDEAVDGSGVSRELFAESTIPLTIGARSDGREPLSAVVDQIHIAPRALDGSVLLRYTFDESGIVVTDASGNGYHGALVGAERVAALSGSALNFSGAAEVSTTYPSVLGAPAQWTFEAWIFDRVGGGSSRTIWSVYGADGNRALWLTPGNLVQFNPCPAGGSPIPTNRWVHVAATYDGDVLRYYVNGKLDAAVSCGAQPINAFKIGRSTAGTNAFDGMMDDVTFHRALLSAPDVEAHAAVVSLAFDEGARSVVHDGSGLANHAAIEGPAAWTIGPSGSALELDGSTLVLVSDAPALSLEDGFSIRALLRRSQLGSDQTIVAKGGDVDPGGWRLSFNESDQLAFDVVGIEGLLATSRRVNDFLWHEVQLVHEGELFLAYLDGQEVARAESRSIVGGAPGPLTIGADSLGMRTLHGHVDELQLVPFDRPDGPLISRYRFEERAGSAVTDSGGNHYDATVEGATFVEDQFGGALDFSNARLNVAYQGTRGTPAVWSFEAWIFDRAGPRSNRNRTIWNVYSADGNRSLWLTPTNVLQFNPCPAAAAPVPSDQWVHVALTYDGGTLRYYLNGALDDAVSCGAQPISFYSLGMSGSGANPFDGKIDEVSFYREVRSAAVIRQDASLASMRFDEGAGSVARDTSGLGNRGTLSAGAVWATGFSGAGLRFDGSGVALSIAPSDSLELGDQFSIELRARLGSARGAVRTLVAQSDGSAGGWALRLRADDRLAFFIEGVGEVVVSGEPWSDPLWHQVTATKKGESYQLWLDGNLIGAGQSLGVPSPGPISMTVGAAGDGSAPFDGTVDELRVAPIADPDPTLELRLRFDEASGTEASDSSGNHYDGTLGAGVSFGAGRAGNGLILGGVAGVSTTYGPVPAPASWTLEAWVYDEARSGLRVIVGVYGADGNRSLWLDGSSRLQFNPCPAGAGAVPSDQWVHVAATYESGVLRYFLNGALDRAVSCGAQPINAFIVGSGSSSAHPWRGAIDEVFFFREARSSAELVLDMTTL